MKCEDCQYYLGDDEGNGICRRFPPVQGIVPRTAPGHWCGEFRPSLTKRFRVYAFPSYRGTPWQFNSRLAAVLAGHARSLLAPGSEIRVIDGASEKLIRVW